MQTTLIILYALLIIQSAFLILIGLRILAVNKNVDQPPKPLLKPLFCHGKPIMLPSKQYAQYENDCKIFLPRGKPIDKPINIKAVYYMPTRRKIDLINLHSALHDVLVKHQVIADDNANIIVSTDGSRVEYDKANPRTEVEITEVTE